MRFTRRDMLSRTLKTGLLATAGAAAAGALPSFSRLLVRDAEAASKAKYTLRFGASVLSRKNEPYQATTIYEFADHVERLSDGEVKLQILDSGQGCAEPTCAERVIGGVYDLGTTTAQNMATVVNYSQALDWPFLWRDRATFFNIFHDPSMNPVYRDVLRKRYGLELLYSGGGEFRDLFMGLKFSDRPEVRTPEALQGAKIRITNSTMIKNFAASLDLNPIPLAWVETLEGMKSGVVDGMETYASAATGFGMTTVTAQVIQLSFSPGNVLVYMSSRSLERLPERLQDVMREAARLASASSFEGVGIAQNQTVGNGADPAPDSDFVRRREQMRHVRLTEAELDAFRARGAVERNPAIYDSLRREFDKIAGMDVFGALSEYERRQRGQGFDPQSWFA